MFPMLLILHSFIYLNIHQYFPGVKPFFIISLVLLVITLLKKPYIVKSSINKHLIILNLFLMLSIAFSSYIRMSFEFYEYFIKIQAIAFITYAMLNSSKRIYVFTIFWLGLQVFLVKETIGVFSMENAGERLGATGLAGTSFLGDANDFALALNIAFPFAFFLWLHIKNNIGRLLALASSLLLITGIVITNSRGGFVTLATVFLILIVKSKNKVIGLAGAALIFTGLFALAPSDYVDRIGTITNSALEEGETGYGRMTLWKAGIDMLIDNPLTGVGLNRYPAAYGDKYHREGDQKWRVAHNSYISVGAETGIGGLLAYLLLLAMIFAENKNIRRTLMDAGHEHHLFIALSNAINIALIAFCIGSIALTVWHYMHLYLLIALTLAIKKVATQELGIEFRDNEAKSIRHISRGRLHIHQPQGAYRSH